jgi:MFS transporter, DHA2 family, multidrug resistance protein
VMLGKRIDLRWLMMFGMASFGFSMWTFTYITSDWGWLELLVPQILRGFPQVFAVAPSVTLGLGSLPPDRLKYASGLYNMMRNLGGAVGIAVCGAVLNDQTNLHFVNIASTLTPANSAMNTVLAELGTRMTMVLGSEHAGHMAALSQLRALAFREASTMAYADAFRTIMVAFMITTPMVFLLRKVAPPKAPSADAH